jgi:copper(I)-binding protein
MIQKARLGLLMALAGLLLAACGDANQGIAVTEAWVRSSSMLDRAGAAYMLISNGGAEADRLLSVTSDVASVIEIHETTEMNGMMEMAPVTALPVPAHGQTELAPGGLHIMLIDLTRELTPGAEVTLTLNFEKAGPVTVTAVVRES